MADFVARGAQAFPPRGLAAFHHARVRGEVLHAGKAAEVMDVIPPHAAEQLADARGPDCSQGEGMGIVVLGGFAEGEVPLLAERIIRGDEGQSDRHGLVARRHRHSARPPRGAALCRHSSCRSRARGIWRWVWCTWATRAARLRLWGVRRLRRARVARLSRRRDRGRREHPATQPGGNLVRVDLCRFWLPRRGGLSWRGHAPGQRVRLLAHSSATKPVPGEETLDGHHGDRL